MTVRSSSNIPILWAQRKDSIHITFDISEVDALSLKVDVKDQHFHAEGRNSQKSFCVDLELCGPVKSEGLVCKVYGKSTTIVVPRAEPGAFWPRLVSDGKYPWLKVDWKLWVDEEEEEKTHLDNNYEDFDFNNENYSDQEEIDEENEELPDEAPQDST